MGARRDLGNGLNMSEALQPLQPLVSVVMPVGGRPRHVSGAVRQISLWREQASPDVEFIIVMQGIEKKDGDSIRQGLSNWDQSRIIEVTGVGGIGEARNVGLRSARGVFVLFLDSDDDSFPTSILPVLNQLKDEPVDVVQFSHAEIRAEGAGLAPIQIARSSLLGPGLTGQIFHRAGVWRFAIRIDFLQVHEIEFPSASYAEDLVFLVDLAAASPRFEQRMDLAYVHHLSGDGASASSMRSPSRVWIAQDLLGTRAKAIHDRRLRAVVKFWLFRISARGAARLPVSGRGRWQLMRSAIWGLTAGAADLGRSGLLSSGFGTTPKKVRPPSEVRS